MPLNGYLYKSTFTGGYFDLEQYFISCSHDISHDVRLAIKCPWDHVRYALEHASPWLIKTLLDW